MRLTLKSEVPWVGPETRLIFLSGQMRNQRPVMDTSKCTWCGTCYLFCPVGCLVDSGIRFEVNLEYCKGCGVCAKMCPVNAISMIREEY